MTSTAAWAAQDAISPLTPTTIERREAYDQLAAGDPGHRYVIDLATLDDHIAAAS